MEITEKLTFDIAYVFDHFIEKKGSINKGCKYIAKRLNNRWVWKYIYNVYKGASPGKELEKKLKALIRPPRKRYRMIIEATSKEQWEGWQNKTMEEKRIALDNM